MLSWGTFEHELNVNSVLSKNIKQLNWTEENWLKLLGQTRLCKIDIVKKCTNNYGERNYYSPRLLSEPINVEPIIQ